MGTHILGKKEAEGLMKERRGRGSKGRPPKLDTKVEEDLIAENQRLRMENEYLKTECLSTCGRAKRTGKGVRNLRTKAEISAEKLLELSGIARSTYYYYLHKQDTDKYKRLKLRYLIYTENKGRYGYRRITQVLKEKGYTINHKTVLKLMKSLGLKASNEKNDKYHSYKGEVGKIADNLLKGDFYAESHLKN